MPWFRVVCLTKKGVSPMEALVRHLQRWLGSPVQLERGGPEACEGLLTAVQADYLCLRSVDGMDLYLPLRHVRSITLLGAAAAPPPPAEAEQLPATFVELAQQLTGTFVRLYHAGAEMTAGHLLECTSDYLAVRSSEGEEICFPLYHLRSLLVLPEPVHPTQGR